MSDRSDLVQVCVRTRPLTEAERQHKKVVFCDRTHCRVEAPGKSARSFLFAQCFDEYDTQESVFTQCGVIAQVERSLDGFASLIFAFGQTGAGKTYTMFSSLGDEGLQWDTEQAGLIPRSMVYLFQLIGQRQAQYGIKYNVRAAFLEIYNEQVSDLLRMGPPLKVHWKEHLGFFAENHVVVECSGADDAIAVVNEGVKNRKVGSHNLNSESSRSHSIFVVDVDCLQADENGERYLQSGRLLFVDLAGSEKLKQTGSTGEVMHEAKNINKSLLTLGKVISTLSRMHKGKGKGDKGTMRVREDGRQYLQQHVPFRDSALTKLLMQSFMGNSFVNVLMICCCAPTMRSADETLATLRYASRAMDIEVNPGARVSLMGERSQQQQQQQIEMLKQEIKKLNMENRRLQQIASSQPSSNLSSPTGSQHFSSYASSYSSMYSNSPKAAHRLTPPPYSTNFLPMIHSPSPSHAPPPISHLTLSHSPSRLSPTNLSPMGSPTKNSPLLQMYQQNQQLLSEESPGIEDLKSKVARLEMLLSEMGIQNSNIKSENSHLFAVCQQTKTEYARLLHKLDTMEAIFFRRSELPQSWSASRNPAEPLKRVSSRKEKPVPLPDVAGDTQKPTESGEESNGAPQNSNGTEEDISYKQPSLTERSKKLESARRPRSKEGPASSDEISQNTSPVLPESARKPPIMPDSSRRHAASPDLARVASESARQSNAVPDLDLPRKATASPEVARISNRTARDSARKSTALPESARRTMDSPDSARRTMDSPNSARKSPHSTRKSLGSPHSSRKATDSPDLDEGPTDLPEIGERGMDSPDSDSMESPDFGEDEFDGTSAEVSRVTGGFEYQDSSRDEEEEDGIETIDLQNENE